MRRVVVIGPVPPPFHGCSVATQALLTSRLRESLDLVHLDTSDRRSLDNLGRWDLANVFLALGTLFRAAVEAVTRRPAVAYIPISQNGAGYLRDGLLILIFSLLGGAAVIVHLHGAAFGRFYRSSRRPMRWFVDYSMRKASRGIVLAEGLRQEFSPWLPEDRIAVVPNGTEVAAFAPATDDQEHDGLRVLFLGNLLRFKGVVSLVEAGARVLAVHPSVKFEFAGRWTYDPMFKCSAEDTCRACLAVTQATANPGAFEFLGEVDRSRVRSLLAASDVLVLPSFDEGMPLVIIEAMAAGKAVISSRDVGAIPDVVVDGETGLLVSPGDTDALAAALSQLADDRGLVQRMGSAGRARCEQLYSMDGWIERMAALLHTTDRTWTRGLESRVPGLLNDRPADC